MDANNFSIREVAGGLVIARVLSCQPDDQRVPHVFRARQADYCAKYT
ncbi:MAG: hypothetical protein ACJAQU_002103 [Loktanella salsilacus]|jgi:hypothetical protein